METYTSLLNKAYDLIQQKQQLPEKFVKVEAALRTPQFSKEDISPFFVDMNEQIQKYKDQFAVIVHELGVVAGSSKKEELVHDFFLHLLDFFKLANTVYAQDQTKRHEFQTLLQSYVTFLETGTLSFSTATQESLFDELTKSAWALTKSSNTFQAVAKQEGGRLKNRTRKHKRKAV
jgi:hypothetical protein